MCRMIKIEKYACNDKQEAEKREFEIVKELNQSMNAIRINDKGKQTINKCQINKHEKYTELLKKYKYYADNRDEIDGLKKLFD